MSDAQQWWGTSLQSMRHKSMGSLHLVARVLSPWMLRLIPPMLMLLLLSVLTLSGCVVSVSDPCMSPRAPSTRAWAAGDKGCACTTPCGAEGRARIIWKIISHLS